MGRRGSGLRYSRNRPLWRAQKIDQIIKGSQLAELASGEESSISMAERFASNWRHRAANLFEATRLMPSFSPLGLAVSREYVRRLALGLPKPTAEGNASYALGEPGPQ
jgi:hypothetical protein